jgi:DedD protein
MFFWYVLGYVFMEKKKLLLVSVSVGLFLVIVIGASMLVFSPRDYSSPGRSEAVPVSPGTSRAALAPSSTETAQTPETAQSLETAQLSGTTQPSGTAGAAVPAPVVSAGQGQSTERTLENIIYINGTSSDNAVRVERLSGGSTRTVITIPGPHENVITVNAPETQGPAVSVTSPVETSAPRTETAASPARTSSPAARPARPSPTAASTGGVEKAQPKPAWWVQTSSYSKKAYADDAKKFLETKGITSVVMNGTVGGKTYYRVRVGPYSSQAEADYWLSLIKTIEGMENSLVWKSSSTLPANSL